MSEKFFPFPDKASSMEILRRDPCFGKIPEQDVPAVFEKAWETGVLQAEQFLRQVQPNEYFMTEALSGMGICVHSFDQDFVVGDTRYFCEYLSEKNIVNVYRKAIEVWGEKNGFCYVDSLNLILAHEYFHYLEWHVIGLVSKQYLVPMIRIGSFTLGKTGIAALSEVAANAFANQVYKIGLDEKLFEIRASVELHGKDD